VAIEFVTAFWRGVQMLGFRKSGGQRGSRSGSAHQSQRYRTTEGDEQKQMMI